MPPSQADGDGSEGGGGGTGVGGHAEDGADGRVNNSPRQPHPQPRRHSHHRSHHHHSPRLGGDTGDGGGGHTSSSTPPQPPPPPPRPSALVVVAGPPTPPPPAPPPPLRYTRLSQFTHRVEIYRGAVSAVHRAACARTGARVVLKCYHRAAMTERHRHKLGREVAAMRALRGPHVASLLARFDDAEAGESVLVLEHCEGGDLFKAMLKAGGSLPEQWVAVEAVAPLLRLLEKAAALGFLHRDIKPENLFLTASGRLRVGDFGLAIQAREELPFSRSGTLDYMAPEVLLNPPLPSLREGEAGADAAALRAHGVVPYGPGVDVWAAGILAYELVLGRAPYEVPDDEAATAALIARGDAAPRFPGEPLYCSADASAPAGSLGAPAPSPRALLVPGPATGGPLPSAQWRAFVRAALTKDPAQRPTAAQLLRHPWLEGHLRRAAAADGRRRASLEALLLEPLALGPGAAGGGGSAAGAGGGAASGGVGGGGGSTAAAAAYAAAAAAVGPSLHQRRWRRHAPAVGAASAGPPAFAHAQRSGAALALAVALPAGCGGRWRRRLAPGRRLPARGPCRQPQHGRRPGLWRRRRRPPARGGRGGARKGRRRQAASAAAAATARGRLAPCFRRRRERLCVRPFAPLSRLAAPAAAAAPAVREHGPLCGGQPVGVVAPLAARPRPRRRRRRQRRRRRILVGRLCRERRRHPRVCGPGQRAQRAGAAAHVAVVVGRRGRRAQVGHPRARQIVLSRAAAVDGARLAARGRRRRQRPWRRCGGSAGQR